MIVGIFLRNFKTYKSINYIPITDEDRFCGLIGNNGIGKSSVLEAIDCFFNEKPWNYHKAAKTSTPDSLKPHIVPVFLIRKTDISSKCRDSAETLSKYAKEVIDITFSPTYQPHVKDFILHRKKLASNINLNFDDFFLLPIGIDHQLNISLSILQEMARINDVNEIINESLSIKIDKKLEPEIDSASDLDSGVPINPEFKVKNNFDIFEPLLTEIRSQIEYIYIPREIDPELFTKLETNEIQVLMGETLTEIISKDVPSTMIDGINNKLTLFIDDLSTKFGNYAYRTSNESRQQKIRKADVYNLIIKAFFGIRKLHKQQGKNWLEISQLSSGEKQKAIIDVAHTLLSQHRKSGANLIIGIDEPESSLHMSACFAQFDTLYEISRNCRQVIFSSHWYGFLPTIESGSATIISHDDKNQHVFDLINLANYREQIKQMRAIPKLHLPHDIRLKSMNDFVQSVITSTIGDDPYNWIICEGSSEKIYLTKYFEDIIKSKKLRIIPVGGAKEIKRFYDYILISYNDFKNEINGKIILLSDTDEELVNYNVIDSDNLFCKRIVNCSAVKTTKLVNIHSNPVSPKTEIEDALNGELFLKVLTSFKNENIDTLDFISDIKAESQNSTGFALDLSGSQKFKINSFFDTGNNKFLFAKKYTENLGAEYEVPAWIMQIRKWLE